MAVPNYPWPVKSGYTPSGVYSQEMVTQKAVVPEIRQRIPHVIAKGSKYYKVRDQKIVRSYLYNELHYLDANTIKFAEDIVPVKDTTKLYFPDDTEVPENKWTFLYDGGDIVGIDINPTVVDVTNEDLQWSVSYQSSTRNITDPLGFVPIRVHGVGLHAGDQRFEENIDFFFSGNYVPDYSAIDPREVIASVYPIDYAEWLVVVDENYDEDWEIYEKTVFTADEIAVLKYDLKTSQVDVGKSVPKVTATLGTVPGTLAYINKVICLRVEYIDASNTGVYEYERSPEGNTWDNPDYDTKGNEVVTSVHTTAASIVFTLQNGLEVTLLGADTLIANDVQFLFVDLKFPVVIDAAPEVQNTNTSYLIDQLTTLTDRTWTGKLIEGTYASAVLDDILFTALKLGLADSDLSVEMVDPLGNNEPLDVTVTDNGGGDYTISVSLETDGGGALISTAQEVIDAVNIDVEAKLLVLASLDGTDDVQIAVIETDLTGGTVDESWSSAANISTVELTKDQPFPIAGNIRVHCFGTEILPDETIFYEVVFESQARTLTYKGSIDKVQGAYPALELFGLSIVFEISATQADADVVFGYDTFFIMAPKTYENYGRKVITVDVTTNDSVTDHTVYKTRFGVTLDYLEGTASPQNAPTEIDINNEVPNTVEPDVDEETIYSTGIVDRGLLGGFIVRNLKSALAADEFVIAVETKPYIDWSKTETIVQLIPGEEVFVDKNGLVTGAAGARYVILSRNAFIDSVRVIDTITGLRKSSTYWSLPVNVAGYPTHNIVVINIPTDQPGVDIELRYSSVGNEPDPSESYYLTAWMFRDSSHYEKTYLLGLDTSTGFYNTEAEKFLGPMDNKDNDALIAVRRAASIGIPSIAVTLVKDLDEDDVYQDMDYSSSIEIAKLHDDSTDFVVLNGSKNVSDIIQMARFRNDPFRDNYSMYYVGCERDLPMGDENTGESRVGLSVGILKNLTETNIAGNTPLIANNKATIDVLLDNNNTVTKEVDGAFIALNTALDICSFQNPGRTSILRKNTGWFTSMEAVDIYTAGAYNMVYLNDVGGGSYQYGEDITTGAKSTVFKFIPDQILKQIVKKSIDTSVDALLGNDYSGKDLAVRDIYTTIHLSLKILVGLGWIAPYYEVDEDGFGTDVRRDLNEEDVQVFYDSKLKGEYFFQYTFFGFERLKKLFGVYRYAI